MNRREFLGLPLAVKAIKPDELALAANTFISLWSRWAKAYNAHLDNKLIVPKDLYLIDEELPRQWREVEKQARKWENRERLIK